MKQLRYKTKEFGRQAGRQTGATMTSPVISLPARPCYPPHLSLAVRRKFGRELFVCKCCCLGRWPACVFQLPPPYPHRLLLRLPNVFVVSCSQSPLNPLRLFTHRSPFHHMHTSRKSPPLQSVSHFPNNLFSISCILSSSPSISCSIVSIAPFIPQSAIHMFFIILRLHFHWVFSFQG